jgi:hypothetical protein
MEKRLKILLAQFNAMYTDEARHQFQATWHSFLDSLPNDNARATAARALFAETLKNLKEYRQDIDALVENAPLPKGDYERFAIPNPYIEKAVAI